MELELNYEEMQNEINEITSRLLEKYAINDSIALSFPDNEKEITQDIFLKLFDNHINNLMEAIQEKEEGIFEKDSPDTLNKKENQMKLLYNTFTQYNKKLYEIIYDNPRSIIISNKENNEDHDNYSTPKKKSELQRKNCKIGLKAFKSDKKPSMNKSYYSQFDSSHDNNDRECLLRNNRRDFYPFKHSKQRSPVYFNNKTYNNITPNPNYPPEAEKYDINNNPYLQMIIMLLILIGLLNLYYIFKD